MVVFIHSFHEAAVALRGLAGIFFFAMILSEESDKTANFSPEVLSQAPLRVVEGPIIACAHQTVIKVSLDSLAEWAGL